MAITYEASGFTSVATATTAWSFTPTAGVQADDVFVVQVYAQDSSPTITPPSGSTVLHMSATSVPSAGDRVSVFLWVATSSATTPVSIGMSVAAAGSVSWVRMRGVDPTSPRDVFGISSILTGAPAGPQGQGPNLTTTGPSRFVLAGWLGDGGGSVSSVTAPTGFTTVNGTITPRKGTFGLKGVQPTAGNTGATGVWTLAPDNTYSGPRVIWQLALTPLEDTPPPGPTGQEVWVIQGVPTSTTHKVSAKTTNATSIRLLASTAPGMAAPVAGGWVTVDAAGWAQPSVSGLTPDADYYFQIEMDDGEEIGTGTIRGPIRTAPVAGAPVSFAFAFGGDNHTTDGQATAHNNLAAHDDNVRMFFSTGDTHSADNTGTTQATHRADWETLLTNYTGFAGTVSRIPFAQTFGDHDAGGGNNSIPGPWTAPNIAAYAQVIPVPPSPMLPNNTAWSFVWGRVRFIGWDTYHQRVSGAKLNPAQVSWFQAQMAEPEPLKVIVQSGIWYDQEPPEGWPNGDGWTDAPAQRTALQQIIENGVGQVLMIHGDQHALAAMSGEGNNYGGFPVVGGSPLSGYSSIKGDVTPDSGRYPTTEDVLVHQHGVVSITDTGSGMEVSYRGYDDSNVVRVSHTFTVGDYQEPYQIPNATGVNLTGPVSRWAKDPVKPLWFDTSVRSWRALVPSTTGHRLATLGTDSATLGAVVDNRQGARLGAVHHAGTTYVLRQHSSGTQLNVYGPTWNVIRQDVTVPLVAADADASPISLLRTSNGYLWAAAIYGGAVRVTRSTDDGATWSAAFLFSLWGSGVTGVVKLVEAGGNVVLIATGNDGAGRAVRTLPSNAASITTGWATETIPTLPGTATSDDHLSAEALPDGRVLAIGKTTDPSASDPLIYSLIRSTGGVWTMQTVESGPDDSPRYTRPRLTVLADRVEVLFGSIDSPNDLSRRVSMLSALGTWGSRQTVIPGGNWSDSAVVPAAKDIARATSFPILTYSPQTHDIYALWSASGFTPGLRVEVKAAGATVPVPSLEIKGAGVIVRGEVKVGGAIVPLV